MDLYFQNLTVGVIIFYGLVSMVLGGIFTWTTKMVAKLSFDKKLPTKKIFIGTTIAFLILVLALILTDEPYTGGR